MVDFKKRETEHIICRPALAISWHVLPKISFPLLKFCCSTERGDTSTCESYHNPSALQLERFWRPPVVAGNARSYHPEIPHRPENKEILLKKTLCIAWNLLLIHSDMNCARLTKDLIIEFYTFSFEKEIWIDRLHCGEITLCSRDDQRALQGH